VPGPQQPFRIQPFTEADAWVILPEAAGDCPAGAQVEIVGMHPASGGALMPEYVPGATA
jgi:molybdopterin molybdotransferase